MVDRTDTDDGGDFDQRRVLDTGVSLVPSTVTAGVGRTRLGDEVRVGRSRRFDRATVHGREATVEGEVGTAMSAVEAETVHARASAGSGDEASAWSATGVAFFLRGESRATAELTVAGEYSVTLAGDREADADVHVEAIVGAVDPVGDRFEFVPRSRWTLLSATDSRYMQSTYEDISYTVTQTADLEPGTAYAVVLSLRTDADSCGGAATADAYSYTHDDSFRGSASWNAITVDWA